MGISLVKFVSHIFWIHDQHSHKPTSFHKKTYTRTAFLSNGFLIADPLVPSVLWFILAMIGIRQKRQFVTSNLNQTCAVSVSF